MGRALVLPSGWTRLHVLSCASALTASPQPVAANALPPANATPWMDGFAHPGMSTWNQLPAAVSEAYSPPFPEPPEAAPMSSFATPYMSRAELEPSTARAPDDTLVSPVARPVLARVQLAPASVDFHTPPASPPA